MDTYWWLITSLLLNLILILVVIGKRYELACLEDEVLKWMRIAKRREQDAG